MDDHKCKTCGKGMKGHCADCQSEEQAEGKCVDCGGENRAMKCEGCDDIEENCTCPPDES
ncbi:MAG: hypothetical protein A3B86_01255 [Candidatus Yanofskybacteria bacterium RIFCSPHIGHO2_02_FULL_38_22b]|uniref:Uncharacterized protein n=1 Tax=Candidatus Yanofskybacteria bacterium RIFCSPHIGHO2_02_FULL_38_22b TaxID=1802673 RepID=A0A1F8F2K9_9BACT|nr:MAG: hypothetical protein A3B86_01255 [Candidatus Yanofskybacteria bacterium RIFCSPHIGHO2_02_FULL_38_22b]